MKKPMQENFKNSITLTYYHKKKKTIMKISKHP